MPPKVPMIPVKKDEDASSYRYKMPKLISRNLSSGNGVKTTIINSTDIAKAIFRTPAALTQWFSYHLACQAKFSNQTNQIVLNGDHSTKKLQDSVYEFIDNFVLCPSCLNPETTLDKKGNTLVLHCHACGHTEPACQGSRSSYVQKTLDWIISHLQTETKQTSGNVTMRTKGRIDEIDEYQKEKAKEVEDGGAGVPIDVDDLKKIENEIIGDSKKKLSEKEENEYIEKLIADLASDKEDLEIFDEFAQVSEQTQWNSLTKLNIVFACVFNGATKEFLNIMKHRRGFLIRVLTDDSVQKDFLLILAKYIEKEHPELLSSAPIIWYSLFENEIVEEGGFKKFAEAKVSKRFEDPAKAKQLRALIKPFYEWLENTDYEPEPEPEVNTPAPAPAQSAPAPAEKPKAEATINIDDI